MYAMEVELSSTLYEDYNIYVLKAEGPDSRRPPGATYNPTHGFLY